MQAFMRRHKIENYEALLARSVDDVAWFWGAVMADLGVQFYRPYTQIIDTRDGIQLPRWCVGGQMNIIHNCLDKWQHTPTAEQIALRWESEEGYVEEFTCAPTPSRGEPLRQRPARPRPEQR
ncbi:MAG: acetyl-coenzyme A synthetase N-terminal domain-containing protein [Caldilineaceae bacterium]